MYKTYTIIIIVILTAIYVHIVLCGTSAYTEGSAKDVTLAVLNFSDKT